MGCKAGVIIYLILQFIAFLFILVGTPIDMFRGNGKDVWGNTPCLTMWGEKEKCYSTKYQSKPDALFALCTGRSDRFKAAEAFAIIHIITYGIAVVFGFVQLCCCGCLNWICLALNIFGITSCISWAIMADAYHKPNTSQPTWSSSPNCGQLSKLYKLGAGFALLVTGWALNFVAMFFVMLPC